jgi:hypothetical protein
MKKQTIYFITLLPVLLAAGFFLIGCQKRQEVEEVFFEFEMHFTVTPAADTIRVGDTLLLTADFSDTLYEALGGEWIPMECFHWNMFLVTRQLINPDQHFGWQKPGTNAFGFLFAPNNGEVTSADFAIVRAICKNGRYQFKLQLVAKEPGVFAFRLQDQTAGFIQLPDRLAPSTPELRRIPVVRLNRYIINDGQTNFQIFKQHAVHTPENLNWPAEGLWPKLEEYATFTFVVK